MYLLFVVPIDNAKMTEKIVFHPEAPVIKYNQKSSKNCCLSSLASAFHIICDNRVATALENRIERSLTLQTNRFKNRIYFIMILRRKNCVTEVSIT